MIRQNGTIDVERVQDVHEASRTFVQKPKQSPLDRMLQRGKNGRIFLPQTQPPPFPSMTAVGNGEKNLFVNKN